MVIFVGGWKWGDLKIHKNAIKFILVKNDVYLNSPVPKMIPASSLHEVEVFFMLPHTATIILANPEGRSTSWLRMASIKLFQRFQCLEMCF